MRYRRAATYGAIALLVSSLGTLPPSVQAASSCRARNATTRTAPRSDLQRVIKAAKPGDKILISGICVGNYRIGKSLILEGSPTVSYPNPTLDGNKRGTVLRVADGTVRIRSLTIQNGYAQNGGGIKSTSNSVHLILKDTTVRWNVAYENEEPAGNGGGILIGDGSLILNKGSRVIENTSDVTGGGIYTDGGLVRINGDARVARNRSAEGGGIYAASGNVWLRGQSSVRGNVAGAGGGIYSDVGTIRMDGDSLITGNRAGAGGGLYGWDELLLAGSASVVGNTATGRLGGGGVHMLTYACDASSPDPWTGAISPNDPDDPPTVEFVSC